MTNETHRQLEQAVIMASGGGTRLRPLTDTLPKPMAPILGKPLLERTVLFLKKQGCRDFIIHLHHLPERITSYFGDGRAFGVKIRYCYSDATEMMTETGGALRKMGSMLKNDFLVVYGDGLHRFDLSPMIDRHLKSGALATIALMRTESPKDGEVVRLDASTGRITEWHVRPHSIDYLGDNFFTNGGLYVCSRRILEFIREGAPMHLDKKVIPRALAAQELLIGFPADTILDINTPERYREAEEWCKKNGEV